MSHAILILTLSVPSRYQRTQTLYGASRTERYRYAAACNFYVDRLAVVDVRHAERIPKDTPRRGAGHRWNRAVWNPRTLHCYCTMKMKERKTAGKDKAEDQTDEQLATPARTVLERAAPSHCMHYDERR